MKKIYVHKWKATLATIWSPYMLVRIGSAGYLKLLTIVDSLEISILGSVQLYRF